MIPSSTNAMTKETPKTALQPGAKVECQICKRSFKGNGGKEPRNGSSSCKLELRLPSDWTGRPCD